MRHDFAEAFPAFCKALTHTYCRMKAEDRKSTRLNSSHDQISYAVFCLKKKKAIPSAVKSSNNPNKCANVMTIPETSRVMKFHTGPAAGSLRIHLVKSACLPTVLQTLS